MCVKTTYRQAGAFSFFFFKLYLPGTGPFFDIAMKLGAFAAKLYRRVKPSKYRKRKDYASIELETMESRSMAATFLAAFGQPVSNDSRTHVTLVPAHAQDKQAAFSTFRASHSVMSQPIRKAARALVSAVRLLDTVVNVEDLAKYDPSGVLNMVVSFGHPMCRDDACVKCVTTRATPCIIAPTCIAGKCVNLGQKKDGSACADFDWGGNSYTGHCQAGKCVSKAVQSYYASKQADKLWIPEGYEAPNVTIAVDRGVYATSEREYMETSLGYWDELARESESCSLNNGGCGSLVCQVDVERKTTVCIDPHGHGFAPAPPAIDFPTASNLTYHYPLHPLALGVGVVGNVIKIVSKGHHQCHVDWMAAHGHLYS
ncbi:unnamed protein product [Closterium sp. NIES-64]|nr:unnamed protein product [Closterium sp. NIES-64]